MRSRDPSTLAGPARFVVALRVRDNDGNPVLAAVQPDGRVTIVNSVYGKEGRGKLSGDDLVRQAIETARSKGQHVYEGDAPPAGYPEPITGMRPEKRDRPILSLPQKGKDERGRSFDQGEVEGDPRGRIVFPAGEFTGMATIELFKTRNLSTFLHESGHLWVEELRADAESPDATDQLRADWQAVQDWFSANGHAVENGVIPVDAHEMWARGVEQYLMEGKAPVAALRSIFEQFRAWLVSIYRTVKALRSPLTPEIRKVMDRLLATDEDIALTADEQALAPLLTDASDMTKAEYDAYRQLTSDARIEERTNVERPIHLSLGVINRHVGEVIHDLTHREAIMQADRFLQSRPVMKAVDDSLGREVRKAFRPWLQRIANEWAQDRAGAAGVEGFVKKTRLNTTIVGMGYRVTTTLLQAAGYANSFEKIGVRWVAPHLKDAVNREAWRFVLSRSKEVAARMDNLDRDIRDNVRKAAGTIGGVSAAKRFAFHSIGLMDRVVVIPSWLGAYDKAIAEGMTEEDAIYAADKAVRVSQGAGAAKDLAAIQTGRGTFGEAGKLLTMFYSYMSAFYQRMRTFGRDVRDAELRDAPALIARAWWLFVVPPLLSELLAGRTPDDDDDESWAEWALTNIMFQIFGPIPILRDAAPVIWNKATDRPSFGYRFTPAQGAVESVVNVAGDVGNVAQGEDTKRATRNAIETVGYFTGLTTGQMAVASQFLVDISYGEQDPESLREWYKGLTSGKTE